MASQVSQNSQFSYNDLKVLRSIVEEFPNNNFELFKSGELLCLKVWFDFDYLQEITTLELQEGRITDHYAVFNLDRDEELQVNFKKTIVNGKDDRLFDIVKKPVLSKKKELKAVKLILQVVKDKKLLRKFSTTDKISKEKAIELSKDSHGIFEDQKTNSKKKDDKKDERNEKKREVKETKEEKKEEKKDETNTEVKEEKNDISCEELSEVACKELCFIISHTLGNMRKMIDKKVLDTMVKCIYKYFVKQTINITLEVMEVDKKEGKNISLNVLSKCKEVGIFHKAKREKSENTKRANPYIEFGKKMRPELIKQHPDMKSKDMLRLIAKLWREREH